jgi:hypothetical protein
MKWIPYSKADLVWIFGCGAAKRMREPGKKLITPNANTKKPNTINPSLQMKNQLRSIVV